jgi:hypothetical protein
MDLVRDYIVQEFINYEVPIPHIGDEVITGLRDLYVYASAEFAVVLVKARASLKN